jgi:hypothetical protein
MEKANNMPTSNEKLKEALIYAKKSKNLFGKFLAG